MIAYDKRKELLITWESIKDRHPGIDIRKEWDKYIRWIRFTPTPSIASMLAFENKWLKNRNVTRHRNPELYKGKKKEILLCDIKKMFDLLFKRRINITKKEVVNLLKDGVTIASVDMWCGSGVYPKNPSFRRFLALKGIR